MCTTDDGMLTAGRGERRRDCAFDPETSSNALATMSRDREEE